MKVNSLKDEIKVILENNNCDEPYATAQMIAEICEKDKEKLLKIWKGLTGKRDDIIGELKKLIRYLDGVSMLNEDLIRENDKFKQQLSNQKYLSYEEVEKIIKKNIFKFQKWDGYLLDVVEDICKLAIPKTPEIEGIKKSQVRTSPFGDEQNEILNDKPIDIKEGK